MMPKYTDYLVRYEQYKDYVRDTLPMYGGCQTARIGRVWRSRIGSRWSAVSVPLRSILPPLVGGVEPGTQMGRECLPVEGQPCIRADSRCVC